MNGTRIVGSVQSSACLDGGALGGRAFGLGSADAAGALGSGGGAAGGSGAGVEAFWAGGLATAGGGGAMGRAAAGAGGGRIVVWLLGVADTAERPAPERNGDAVAGAGRTGGAAGGRS